MNGIEAIISLNNAKLRELNKYEQEHRDLLINRAVYWAVEHEIEYLKKQNKELAD